MITIKEMLNSGVHFGHQTRFWNPKMARFIFGHRNKVHIINLEKTINLYQRAIKYIKKISENQGTVLFVGTKQQAKKIIFQEAKKSKSPYINQRWLGGTLTNFKTIQISIKRLHKMKSIISEYFKKENIKNINNIKKKEILIFNKKFNKLKKNFGGIKNMRKIPDAIFIIDVGYHKNAVIEAQKLNIPIIGIVDTNHNPDGIKYIIPGNDDSIKAIKLYTQGISNAIINGRNKIN